jgi:uncharacterized membrane protein/thiol-disulfide isomerase/thioredoxin
MMRRHVLQIGSAVGLIIGWLWLATFAVPSSAAQGAGTPTPQPTVKTCHICDEDETAATPTKAAIPAALPAIVAPPGPERPIVHAVMFWLDGCSHCHDVIENVLPPLQQKYGEQFDLQLIEVVTTEDIDHLYEVGASFGLAKEQVGVPFLIIGDRALVGSDQIPAELPQLIEQHLATGGVAYPQMPGPTPPSMVTAAGCSVATPCADSAAQPVVHAALFWTADCSACRKMVGQTLPPLREKYGSQLDIQLIDVVTAEDVDRLYQVAATFGVSKDQVHLPLLIIGSRVLIGSEQIPAELPGLIEQHLAAGGVAFPDITTLALAAPDDTAVPAATPAPDGLALAIAIMIGMVGALIYSGFTLTRRQPDSVRPASATWRDFAFVTLTLIGLGVAGYLAYVETQAVAAVCGPVGDCNAVQTSEYAYLFGVLPIGVLGVVGYVLILIAWLWGRLRSDRLAEAAPLIVFGLTAFGVVFSLYLTFLEPFVIQAVCIWCLTSAVIMMLLMLLSLRPARISLARRRSKE